MHAVENQEDTPLLTTPLDKNVVVMEVSCLLELAAFKKYNQFSMFSCFSFVVSNVL